MSSIVGKPILPQKQVMPPKPGITPKILPPMEPVEIAKREAQAKAAAMAAAMPKMEPVEIAKQEAQAKAAAMPKIDKSPPLIPKGPPSMPTPPMPKGPPGIPMPPSNPRPGNVTIPAKPTPGAAMKRGGAVRSKPQTKFASGGSVSSASKRGDGIAQRGKTRGRMC